MLLQSLRVQRRASQEGSLLGCPASSKAPPVGMNPRTVWVHDKLDRNIVYWSQAHLGLDGPRANTVHTDRSHIYSEPSCERIHCARHSSRRSQRPSRRRLQQSRSYAFISKDVKMMKFERLTSRERHGTIFSDLSSLRSSYCAPETNIQYVWTVQQLVSFVLTRDS